MVKQMRYGEWAFLIGMALAVILGISSSFLSTSTLPIIWAVLAVLGIIVGLLNISEKEVNAFLIATIALLAVSSSISPIATVLSGVSGMDLLVKAISGFLSALAVFISPAAFIVALKAIYALAKSD